MYLRWMMLALVLLTACGSEETEPAATNSKRGFTSCGSVTCQPGQYCESAPLDLCSPGCTSDLNCDTNQSCVDPDLSNVGVCANTGAVCGNGTCETGEDATSCAADCGAVVSQQAFCDKLLVCEPTGTLAQCQTLYTATNTTCHQCIVDGNCGDINAGSCDAQCGAGGGGGGGGGSGNTCQGVPVNLIECAYDSDCGVGNHCEGGECFDGSWGNPCSYDSDCDTVCTNGCCQ